MNHHQLTNLCHVFALGTPLNTPKRVHGGLLHCMWRINTDEASYAVKQLSSHIDLANEAIIKNYDLTEALGIQIYERNKSAAGMSDEEKRKLEKEEELKSQHTTYLLRLLGFSTDILRCVYDKEKLNAQHDNAEDHISNIKKKVDHFIDGYIQN